MHHLSSEKELESLTADLLKLQQLRSPSLCPRCNVEVLINALRVCLERLTSKEIAAINIAILLREEKEEEEKEKDPFEELLRRKCPSSSKH